MRRRSREAEDAQAALVLPRLVLVVPRVGEQVARGVPRDRVHRSRAGDGVHLGFGFGFGLGLGLRLGSDSIKWIKWIKLS